MSLSHAGLHTHGRGCGSLPGVHFPAETSRGTRAGSEEAGCLSGLGVTWQLSSTLFPIPMCFRHSLLPSSSTHGDVGQVSFLRPLRRCIGPDTLFSPAQGHMPSRPTSQAARVIIPPQRRLTHSKEGAWVTIPRVFHQPGTQPGIRLR